MSTYDISNLINFRLIYLIFPNCDALRHELTWIERIFINSLNELSNIAAPSALIGVHPWLIDRTVPAEVR